MASKVQQPVAAPAGRRLRGIWTALLLAASCGVAPAPAQTTSQDAAASAAPAPADPLGRDTPRGTIAGFNLAVHREDFVSALRYMQVSPAQRRAADGLARDLNHLIDRYYIDPLTALSDAPEGATDDGLDLDRERVGLTIDGENVDIELVRVQDSEAGPIWLVSSQTLAQVPSLRRAAGVTWLESVMPEALVGRTIFGLSIAQWIAWAATFAVPLAALWLLTSAFITIARHTTARAPRRTRVEAWSAGLRWPTVAAVTLGAHLTLIPLLGFSLASRFTYTRLAFAAAVVAAAFLLWRLMTLSFTDARLAAQRRRQASVRSLLLLAERVCKVLIVIAAAFVLLTVGGVDTTTALAGLGIGGVAIALGAQKSVENLLGGVFLLTDRALAVGDTCTIGNRLGVVEDITMRSVRLRTLEQTLLSVPAGTLSQSSVENFATRDKILVQSTLRLRYGTTVDQLRNVLSGIRAILEERRDIETGTARVRLVDFGVRAIEIELFAYVLTPDLLEFLAAREDLLLQIAAIVEASGSSFARPTIVYEELSACASTEAPAGAPLTA